MPDNYLEAARILSQELAEQGYKCRLVTDHKHPRLYISDGETEKFTVLSSTSNYDQGNLLKIKRQDIKRDVLPLLKTPEVPVPEKIPEMQESVPVQPSHMYKAKITIHRGGHLAVYMPKDAIPVNRPQAVAKLTSDHRLYIQFLADGGTVYGKTRSDDIVAYTFHKEDVPFKFVNKKPPDYQAEYQPARFAGGCLSFDKPFPQELRVGKKKVSAMFSLEDGKELLAMFHEWVEHAEKEGLEPEITVENNRVKISVIEKRRTEL